MKKYFHPLTVSLMVAAALSFAGCKSMEFNRRVQAHQAAWQKLSPADQARLSQRIVKPGDSLEVVLIAWGEPSKRYPRYSNRGRAPGEVWEYDTDYYPSTPEELNPPVRVVERRDIARIAREDPSDRAPRDVYTEPVRVLKPEFAGIGGRRVVTFENDVVSGISSASGESKFAVHQR